MEEYEKLQLEHHIINDYLSRKMGYASIACMIGLSATFVGALIKKNFPQLELYCDMAASLPIIKAGFDFIDGIFLDAKVKSIESKLEKIGSK